MAGNEERGCAVFHSDIGVGAFLEQVFHGFFVAIITGYVQWGGIWVFCGFMKANHPHLDRLRQEAYL